MPRPMIEKRELLTDVVRPIFDLLEQQGRKDKWLADQLRISPKQLSEYKRGVNYMSQDMYEKACRVLRAPADIRSRRLPIPQPGRYDRSKLRRGA